MTIDYRILDSASDVKPLNLYDVLTSSWVVKELSKPKVDKKDSVWHVTSIYHEIVQFNIEMIIMVIMQWLENQELKMRC